jgi:hypothetical protein
MAFAKLHLPTIDHHQRGSLQGADRFNDIQEYVGLRGSYRGQKSTMSFVSAMVVCFMIAVGFKTLICLEGACIVSLGCFRENECSQTEASSRISEHNKTRNSETDAPFRENNVARSKDQNHG